jgi:hypothetical protein
VPRFTDTKADAVDNPERNAALRTPQVFRRASIGSFDKGVFFMRGLLIGLALATLAGVMVSSICCAGPTVTVGVNVPAARRVPVDNIDHSAWDRLLKKYVDANGYVAYAAWHASAADQKALDDYLNHLSEASFGRDSSREAQLAFWINAYNAVSNTKFSAKWENHGFTSRLSARQLVARDC